MFDQTLRQHKASALRPAASALRQVSPSVFTLAGLLVGLGAALAAASGSYSLGLALWILNRLLDGLDGEIARASGRQSDLGGYLDILADYIVYAAVPVGLAYAGATEFVYLGLALLLSSFYLNAASWMYLAAILEKRGSRAGHRTSIVMPGGLVEGTETVLFYTAMLLFPTIFGALSLTMAALVFATVVQRLLWSWRHLAPPRTSES
jgi:phosphatidylglycerophosphate synthase